MASRSLRIPTAGTGVVSNIEQVTAAWLTSALARAGALAGGEVESFSWDNGKGNWSSNASLHLRYSTGAGRTAPTRLFLKMVECGDDDEVFGDSEVTYYTRDYVDLPDAPLLRCYDAAYSEHGRRYHLLLEDVSETHVTAREQEPSLEYGLALAEALATLHARWWGAEGQARAGAPIHDAAHLRRFAAIAEPGVAPILARFAGQLRPHWPDALHELFALHPHAMIRRAEDANGFTLIHGDVGVGNVLVPRHGGPPLYLIDRQPFDWALTTWLGVYDLAYAMVLDWETEARRRWEMPVLRRYHAQLIARGVRGYSWERLFDDYRLCVAMGVYVATEYCRGGINERWIDEWLGMLQRALTACDDLDCRELWQANGSE
jgi:hypothetical protein